MDKNKNYIDGIGKAHNRVAQYGIMHGNQKVADLNRNGTCHVG